MDQMMVDITDIPDVKLEDTVTLIGKDGIIISVLKIWRTLPEALTMNLFVM